MIIYPSILARLSDVFHGEPMLRRVGGPLTSDTSLFWFVELPDIVRVSGDVNFFQI